MTPFFSIIIPAYNVEKYISQAITSIINKSFHDYEIIIVNDGSVDKTAEIIKGYAKNNEKIKIINHIQNESQHIARMDGVAASNGQYIVFLDADDYFTDDALNILFDEIQKNTGYDFYEYGYIRQPSGNVVLPSFTGEDRFTAFFNRDNCPMPTMWNKVYNSELIKKAFTSIERVYINMAEDLYESIVISYYAKNIYIINKTIINYSIGTGTSTTYKNYIETLDFLFFVKRSITHIKRFIEKTNQEVNLDNINYRFLSFTIYYYINSQKNIEEKMKLFLQLPDFFDTKIIMEYLFNHEELYNDLRKKLNSINFSKDYRLGSKLLYPLRKIKQFLKC
jgi:glycosyltransferase involved in cell wall biosynthesis